MAQFDVLFASPARLASLTGQQRAWLRQAAAAASTGSVMLAAGQNAASTGQACARGARFVTAVVVIDDQHTRAHPPIVADTNSGRIVASTNPGHVVCVQARTQDCGPPRFARACSVTFSARREGLSAAREDESMRLVTRRFLTGSPGRGRRCASCLECPDLP